MNHQDLDVYRRAFDAAMAIFQQSKTFPKEEQYALTDQIRRSSRSVCANLAEGWRRRRYEQAFINKLSIAEGEAAETQVWLEFAVECGYCQREAARELYKIYAGIIATIVGRINHADTWIITETRLRESPELYTINDSDEPGESI
jgi:four helix bundle protein